MVHHLEHRIDLLPPVLQEIAHLVGVDATIVLAKKYGGQRVYFPEALPHGHQLAKLIGRPAATILCRHYSRDRITIPTARVYLRWHEARVYRSPPYSKTPSQIATLLGVRVSHVRKLLRGFEPDAGDGSEEPPEAAAQHRCPSCGRRASAGRPHGRHDAAQLDFGFPIAGA
jgi:hypothetical protein